jgi:hypothetical protein
MRESVLSASRRQKNLIFRISIQCTSASVDTEGSSDYIQLTPTFR